MLQMTRSGTVWSGTSEDLSRLRHHFDQTHWVRLPQLMAPALLDLVTRQIEKSSFVERVHEGIQDNKELCMTHNATVGLLTVLLNNDDVFHVVQTITGCGRIGCFTGRVYRVAPNQGHHDAWHSDLGDHRLVALSLNLSPAAYTGGLLQIRDRDSGKILQEAPNTGFGDAILFRLAPDLQHRISDIEGDLPKTAFAGWFQAQPNFRDALKARVEIERGRSSHHVTERLV